MRLHGCQTIPDTEYMIYEGNGMWTVKPKITGAKEQDFRNWFIVAEAMMAIKMREKKG